TAPELEPSIIYSAPPSGKYDCWSVNLKCGRQRYTSSDLRQQGTAFHSPKADQARSMKKGALSRRGGPRSRINVNMLATVRMSGTRSPALSYRTPAGIAKSSLSAICCTVLYLADRVPRR